MKKIFLAATLALIMLAGTLRTVEAAGPSFQSMSMGQGPPASDDDLGPGPMNGRSEEDLGQGMMFRYGQEIPEVSIGSDGSAGSLNMAIDSIMFRNGTTTYDITPEDEDWEVEETNGEDEKYQYSYSTESRWKKGGKITDVDSDINIDYGVRWSDNDKRIDHFLSLSNDIGSGQLTIKYRFSLEGDDVSDCCMNSIGTSPDGKLMLYDEEMNPLGEISQEINATVTIDENMEGIEIDRDVEVTEGSGILTVSMNIDEDVQSVETGGVIAIMDEFIEVVTEGAEEAVSYVLDHIYSFSIGIAIIMIILIISVVVFARRRSGKDMSDELDLRKSPIFKGPMR